MPKNSLRENLTMRNKKENMETVQCPNCKRQVSILGKKTGICVDCFKMSPEKKATMFKEAVDAFPYNLKEPLNQDGFSALYNYPAKDIQGYLWSLYENPGQISDSLANEQDSIFDRDLNSSFDRSLDTASESGALNERFVDGINKKMRSDVTYNFKQNVGKKKTEEK
jgi:hypothetical protein